MKTFSSSRTLLTQRPIAQGMVSSQSPVVFTVLPSLCDSPAEWLLILWITGNMSAGNLQPVHIMTNYQMISGARCVNLLELSHGSRRGTLNKRSLGFHRVEATSPNHRQEAWFILRERHLEFFFLFYCSGRESSRAIASSYNSEH